MYYDLLKQLGAQDMACVVFSTLKLEISFKMSVLRSSETAWVCICDLLCILNLEA